MILRTANPNMEPELRNILKVCFNEKDVAIDLLFKEHFKEHMTTVGIVDGKIVSSVYIFENSIIYNKTEIPSCYMYAVATLPYYQGRGYMKKLLKYSEEVARQNGKIFSTLYPADENLCKFYEKLGYEQFFKTCIIDISDYELNQILLQYKKDNNVFGGSSYEVLVKTKIISEDKIDYLRISQIRKNAYCKTGDVYWNQDHISYAIKINKIYGGDTIFTGDNYAICRENNDLVEVVDSVISEEDLFILINAIRKKYQAKKYRFRLSPKSQLFKISGRDLPFGMIKPLTDNEDYTRILLEVKRPYLGLVLD